MSWLAAFNAFRTDFATLEAAESIDHVFWPNEEEAGNAPNEEFLRVSVASGDAVPELVCGADGIKANLKTRFPGNVQIQIFEPLHAGYKRASDLYDAIYDRYTGDASTSLEFQAPTLRFVRQEGEMYQFNVILPFLFRDTTS